MSRSPRLGPLTASVSEGLTAARADLKHVSRIADGLPHKLAERLVRACLVLVHSDNVFVTVMGRSAQASSTSTLDLPLLAHLDTAADMLINGIAGSSSLLRFLREERSNISVSRIPFIGYLARGAPVSSSLIYTAGYQHSTLRSQLRLS